jgi:16S rRNA (cytosine1402-N4)-methyltransferase
MTNDFFHRPVLVETAVEFLITKTDGVYVDCTLGGGGHSELILQKLQPKGRLLGIDADSDAISTAEKNLRNYPNKFLRLGFFDQLDAFLTERDLLPASGILFDLGISSFQIDEPRKGFSFQSDGPLDMRFNKKQEFTAERLVNNYSQEELEKILFEYGEERNSRRIARRIVESRQISPILSTTQLASILKSVISERYFSKSMARIFQAIRIEVNAELDRLQRALKVAFDCLHQSGRMVIITYHSLEDRIVKEFFREKERDCICPPEFPQCICDKQSALKILTKKVIVPDSDEIRDNPRSRSAKLRAAEKIIEYEAP